jgi:hypothetical protein
MPGQEADLFFFSINKDEMIKATPTPFRKSPISDEMAIKGDASKTKLMQMEPNASNHNVCFFML